MCSKTHGLKKLFVIRANGLELPSFGRGGGGLAYKDQARPPLRDVGLVQPAHKTGDCCDCSDALYSLQVLSL